LHNTFESVQKSATYAANSFQLLEANLPKTPDLGLCPWTPLGHSPQILIISSILPIPPNLGRLHKRLSSANKLLQLDLVKVET